MHSTKIVSAVVVVLWLVLAAAVVGVYRLGYVRGEIAALCRRGGLAASEEGVAIPSDAASCRVYEGEVAR